MRKFRIFILLITLMCLSGISYGQSRFSIYTKGYARFTKPKRYWSVGGGVNASHYLGDVAPSANLGSMDWRKTKPSLSLFAMKRLLPRFSVRFMFTQALIEGDDANANIGVDVTETNTQGGAIAGFDNFFNPENAGRFVRNLHFRNNITELNTMIVYDFIKNDGLYYRRRRFPIPYISAGIGVFYHSPMARDVDNPDKWVHLRSKQTEGVSYLPVALAMPLGVGVRWRITNKLDIAAEATVRYTTTDYLDDVSSEFYASAEDMNSTDAYRYAYRAHENYGKLGDDLQYLEYLTRAYEGGAPNPTDYNEFTEIGEIRGDPTQKDVYVNIGIHVNYIFRGNLKTPRYRYR
ncbi:DUF6089 family protein [Algivirga pacifica]|uniref:DUF6089 domain-containing protein n=1 Tax=Algivirga pacifica TaxID=1162670 RepID=A0ABP9DF29_9BACT